jgi:hypothetical protein
MERAIRQSLDQFYWASPPSGFNKMKANQNKKAWLQNGIPGFIFLPFHFATPLLIKGGKAWTG